MFNFKLSEEQTQELVALSEKFQILRDSVASISRQEDVRDEDIREKFTAILDVGEEFNDLYKRSIIPQMVATQGEDLLRCLGYSLQMTEAIALSMAQLNMSPEERNALFEYQAKVTEEKNAKKPPEAPAAD